MNITGIKSAKYGSSFHKSPLFFCQRQADNSVNTPMLPETLDFAGFLSYSIF